MAEQEIKIDPEVMKSLRQKPNKGTSAKKIIGVVSGKGGVGKSMVTSLLSVMAAREGKKVGIMDADITGPSIPKMFGVHTHATSDGTSLYPVTSRAGLELMSINLLLPNEDDPVVWRGPVISGTIRQFWTDVVWGDLDVLFIDMPPGTGDVALTVFQSLPLDGLIIVTSPQDLVSMIVGKAVKMANQMNIEILGVVENMSYIICPDCGKKIEVFGQSKLDEVAKQYDLDILGRLPMRPDMAAAADAGLIETVVTEGLEEAVKKINSLG